MLDELHAANVALIREATIVPSSGLTVLTGETGAGKTALLSAVKLAVGERADSDAVREGEEALEVEARFFPRAGGTDGTVVRRRVSADGRGRVEIDGRMASVHELQQSIGESVDLCGQHEHQRLLSVATHVELLDAWAKGDATRAKEAWVQALEAASAAKAELERVTSASHLASEKLEEARYTLTRIDEVAPKEGEYEQISAELPRYEHAQTLLSSAYGAREAIVSDDGARDALVKATRMLEQAADYDSRLQASADSLSSLVIELDDVASSLRDYADNVEFDPAEHERLEARFSALEGLKRAFGPRMEDVFARREQASELLNAHDMSDERLRECTKALQEAEAALARAADALDEVRKKAAPDLEEALAREMGRLEMGSASIKIAQERLPREQWTQAGPSHIELMYTPGEGLSARPLKRIASGGEVSRVMLAAKLVLGASDAVETLVFDEVDAGVGGATAVALASVLAELSKTHQVIVVTHLAQVAVMADCHYVVEKHELKEPETLLKEVRGEDRVREIARMLSGDVSETSLVHAREMLEAKSV